jgi:hypothetical protein
MKSLLLVLLLCFPVLGQDFNLDNFVPVQTDDVQPEVNILDYQPIDLNEFNTDDESIARLEEMRKLADEIKKIAEDIRAKNQTVKMTYDDSKISDLESRVSKLENDSLNYVTKDKVVELVKEEVAKHVRLTLKSGNTTKEISIPLTETTESVVYNSVSIPGYAGSFDIPQGAVITHVDGVPVNKINSSNTIVSSAYTSQYYMQGVKQNNGWRMRVASPKSCRYVNGILQCN